MRNHVLQPLITWDLYYYTSYSQIWQDGDSPYEGFPPINSYDPLITWSCEVTWQTKTNFHYQGDFDYQTWQDGNLHWWAPAQKVTWNFDHIVLQVYVTNWNHYISITTVPMAIKLGKMMTYFEVLLSMISHDALITRPLEIS